MGTPFRRYELDFPEELNWGRNMPPARRCPKCKGKSPAREAMCPECDGIGYFGIRHDVPTCEGCVGSLKVPVLAARLRAGVRLFRKDDYVCLGQN